MSKDFGSSNTLGNGNKLGDWNTLGDGNTLGNCNKLGIFKTPAQSMMLTEEGDGGGCPYVLSYQYYACAAPHNDGANTVFVDGHAKWAKFERAPIPPPWNAPYSSSQSCHPPLSYFTDPF